MWPFKRKDKNLDAVPAEVQEYYQAEKRERVGLAWILAFVTLAATVAVVLGLFFGGRALYRHYHDKNAASTQPADKPTETKTPTPTPSSSSATPTPSSLNSSSTSGNNSGQPSSSSTSPTNPSASTNTSSQPATGTMANTGPGETAAVGFTLASILGFGLYQVYLRKKLTN